MSERKRTSKIKPDAVNVSVRMRTRQKLDAIRAPRRWSLTETVDALADSFIESNGIRIVEPTATRTPVGARRPAVE
jgi:hypothetical protein